MRNEMMKGNPTGGAMMMSGGEPATPRDAADIADAIAQAAHARAPLRIVGAGSWLDAGRPAEPHALPLAVGALRGIVEYVPADLTLTARAGTSLADIDAATREFGQWLPLDPWGDRRATLGATLATASSGPLASSLGAPRDLALGIEFVDGRGVPVRGGGRVVKNVAGFDLVRLSVGAWGTLGVITEATVRLRARPEGECTLAVAAPRDPDALRRLLAALRDAPLTPLAMELVDPTLAQSLGAGHAGATVLVRLAGNATSIAAQHRAINGLASAQALPSDVWSRWGSSGVRPDDWTCRVSAPPSDLHELWDLAGSIVGAPFDGWRHASVERGLVRVVLPSHRTESVPAVVESLVTAVSGRARVVGERLPAAAWRFLPPASDPLTMRVRQAFDPALILNRGLLDGQSTA